HQSLKCKKSQNIRLLLHLLLGFDEQKEQDQSFDIKGITVVMQKTHAIYLLGMEIDWSDGLDNRGFIFNNPNATDTCGCGTSFSA
ncbi:MAG: iron-sulfur cluster assembly accessory protein, partial [Bacteroidota bacterium]